MKSSTYLNILKLRNSCNIEELQHTLTDLFADKEIDKGKQIEEFYEIVNASLQKSELIGTSADFHNVGVECARNNAEDIACDYIERGLVKYPASVDLLADYIKYGAACDRIEECEKYYCILNEIPKTNWNWRAFRFSIDYLMIKLEKGDFGSELKQTMLVLADEFRQYLPNDENSYLAQAEIYSRFNEREREIASLEEAVAKIAKAPKSLLRLSDIYYEDGRFEEALIALHRCELDSLEAQMGVSQGYLYYLDGLCQSNILMRELADDNQMEKDVIREKVIKIYDNLRLSKKSLDKSFNIQTEWKFLVTMLEVKTKIEYPYY